MNRPHSRAVEDFLKAIYILQQQNERVSTNALSEELNITAPSVTNMAHRLHAEGLVDYRKYYGLRLTEIGLSIAVHTVRRHRLIELYLVQELGYTLIDVHLEAENLEHAVSDQFVEAINHKLNYPTFDPHGDPIPQEDGSISHRNLIPLVQLEVGQSGIIQRLKTQNPAMLEYTLSRGLELNTWLQLISLDPFDGPVTLALKDKQIMIAHQVAQYIYIELDDHESAMP